MQPGFFCNSGASLLSSLLTTTTLWGSLLSSSLLTTLLWSSLSSSLLTTTTLWCSLSSSLLTTTLWCCLRSSFLTTLCSHVDFLSEWFDPSPNLFKANRDSIYGNFPLFWVKNAPACRISFFQKNVLLLFFKGAKLIFFMREKCKNRIFLVFDAILRDPVTRG
jgi:hypothetical protein